MTNKELNTVRTCVPDDPALKKSSSTYEVDMIKKYCPVTTIKIVAKTGYTKDDKKYSYADL